MSKIFNFIEKQPDRKLGELMDLDLTNINLKAGTYVFISKQTKFIFPNGHSRVIYIGKSDDLISRLKTHKRHLLELSNLKHIERKDMSRYSRYQYMLKFGCIVYCYTTRGTQNSKNLENIIMESFYNRYHALPVGNGAVSFKK